MSEIKKLIILRILIGISFAFLGIFLNIFVYKNLNSIPLTIYGNMFSFLGTILGFSFIGYLISLYKYSIDKVFSLGIFSALFSFIILLFGQSQKLIFTFLFFWGLCIGLIWNGINTLELSNIPKKERNIYTAKTGFYLKIISVIAPLIISFLFLIFNQRAYFFIFSFSAISFIFCLINLKKIEIYLPEKVDLYDFKTFYKFKNKYIHIYGFLNGIEQALNISLFPIATLFILKNELNIGFFTTIISIISITLLYFGMKIRADYNPGKVLIALSILFSINILIFAISPNFITFIVLSGAELLLAPQINISKHNLDLYTMHIGSSDNKKFYPNMLFREINLFVGRIFGGFLLVFTIMIQTENRFILSYGFILLAIIYVLSAFIGSKIYNQYQ